jgi:hypothetical protein
MEYQFKSLETHEWDKLFAIMEEEKKENPFAKKEDKSEEKKENPFAKKEDKSEEKKEDKKEDKKAPPFQKKDSSKDDKGKATGKVPSKNPGKDDAAKFVQQEQKDLDIIFKKVVENFKKFQITASDKLAPWGTFVANNMFKQAKPAEGLQMAYKLWDTDYSMGLYNDPKSGKLVFIVRKDGDPEPVFYTTNRDAIKKHKEFYNNVKSTITNFKQRKQEEREAAIREEKERVRKEKLGGFLKA